MSDESKSEEQQPVAAVAEPEAPAAVSDAEEEEEEEETHVPAHDVTATTVSGSRVRRSTQKFTVDEPKADDTEEFQPPLGKGQKIKDIALVNDIVAALSKKQAEILKALYLAMYGRRFQLKNLKVIKEHILEFSGIPEQDEKAREMLFTKLARWKRSFVQEVMDVLGVDRSKKSFDEEEKTFDKDSLVNRLIDWLYNPQEKKGGRKPSTPKSTAKKTKKAAEKAKIPAAKRKRTTKEPTAAAKKKQKTMKKGKATAAAEESEDEEEDDAEEEDNEAHSEDESASDFDESEKKKPAKKTKKATAAAKKSPTAKRAPRKPKSSKPIESDDDDESDHNSSVKDAGDKEDNKPETKPKPAKRAKNAKDAKSDEDDKSAQSSSSALDADVKAKVKQIIEQGNAEELTVKKIVRQVSEELGRDLSGEKNAIKEFIKAGHQPFADINPKASKRLIDRSITMGSKRSKKTTTAATTSADATDATAALVATVKVAKPAPAPVAVTAAAPKQETNALADMFAQSSVLFAKKASYVQADAAPTKKKQVAEAAELASSVSSLGKRKRSQKTEDASSSSTGKTQAEYDAEDAADELAALAELKKQMKVPEEEEEGGGKPAKKQKKKKHKKLAKEAAEAAATAAAPVATETETAEPSKDTATDEEKSQRSIFVGNVSLDATQKDLKTFFSQCGKVESVRLRFMPIAGCAVDQAGNQKLMMKVCANKKILSDSKDNCNAYVTFAEQKSVEKALLLNGATFMLMKIRVDHENPVVDPKRSVFVGNVGFNVSDEKVRKFFEKRLKSDEEPNPVENVRIIRDRASGVGKGFGYVLLKSATLAGKALSLHETSLDSRPIRVQVCGKRFKNKKGEEDDAKKKHEGIRASAGAKARVALKRKASGKPLPAQTSQKKVAASSSSAMKPKPKHAARKALQAKDDKSGKGSGAAKRVFKKVPGGKDKKFSKKSSSSDRTPKPKVKKPKHAARKARQAAEAAATGK